MSRSAGCQVMGVTGFLALAGLFTAGFAYRIGASRKQAIAPSQLPSDPEIEHPELRLTTLPREALSDAHLFDQATRTEQEVALTRRR